MISRRSLLPGLGLLVLASPTLARSALADKPPPAPGPSPAPSPAPPVPLASIAAEVMVISATSGQTPGIDPSLVNLKQLKEPPFSSYNTFKLLSQIRVGVAKDKVTNVVLPDQGKLSLKRLEVPARYKLGVNILKGSGDTFLANLEVTGDLNEMFFVAGQVYQRGILIIGIRFVTP